MISGSDVVFSKSSDGDYPLCLLLRRSVGKAIDVLDRYEVSGSLPTIEAVFIFPVNYEENIVVLVSWDVNSRGIGAYGKLYQVYAYKKQGKTIARSIQVEMDGGMGGMDGYQDGQRVTFNLRTASDIREYLDRKRY